MLFRNAARTHGRHPARTGLRAGVLAVVVAAALVSCTQASSGGGPDADTARTVDAVENADRAEREAGEAAEAGEADPTSAPSPGPALVRDAFATLQATLDDTCTPGAGDCAYFLGQGDQGTHRAGRVDAGGHQGPGHFKKPLADMKALFTKLGDDRSEPHLEKHFSEIVGTRDSVNAWMQDHPDGYR